MFLSKKISPFLSELIMFMIMLLPCLCYVNFAWAADETSVITKVGDRAIAVIEAAKPIVYILGGFGLICVAWGAIFGKMNWKWFSGLAIGLFILAYMGHLIDFWTRNRGDLRLGNSNNARSFKGTTLSTGFRNAFKDTITERPRDDSGKFVSLIIRGTDEYPGDFEDTLTMPDLPPDNQVDPGSIAQDEDDSEDGEEENVNQ